eukprot:3515829-Rhodomonas_salina.1
MLHRMDQQYQNPLGAFAFHSTDTSKYQICSTSYRPHTKVFFGANALQTALPFLWLLALTEDVHLSVALRNWSIRWEFLCFASDYRDGMQSSFSSTQPSSLVGRIGPLLSFLRRVRERALSGRNN